MATDPRQRFPQDTLSDVVDPRQNVRGRVTRRVTVGVMSVLVLLGLTGALGEHTSTATASGGGYSMSVDYARVSRAGLDSPWTVTVQHPEGFDSPVVLVSTADYFDIFESQGLDPEPTEETSSGSYTYQTFSPPPGDTFQVSFDAYIQPASQIGRSGTTTLIVDGRAVARVSYRTWLLP